MSTHRAGPGDILATYQRVGARWAAGRSQALFERGWLQRMVAAAPGRQVLDLGCGSGRPLAMWLAAQGMAVTGVDGAAAMCALFRANLPGRPCHHADMRRLALGERFDAILAWNSFFHLSPPDQRAMFATFAAHARPGAILMFTTGPRAGEPIGEVAGEAVYHASLDPADYRRALANAGFDALAFCPEDPDCAGHTIWLARFGGHLTGV